MRGLITKEEFIKLSIPFWSDFIVCVISVFSVLFEFLSIPFWSDFIGKTIYVKLDEYQHFQSHFGLILSVKKNFVILDFS